MELGIDISSLNIVQVLTCIAMRTNLDIFLCMETNPLHRWFNPPSSGKSDSIVSLKEASLDSVLSSSLRAVVVVLEENKNLKQEWNRNMSMWCSFFQYLSTYLRYHLLMPCSSAYISHNCHGHRHLISPADTSIHIYFLKVWWITTFFTALSSSFLIKQWLSKRI